MSNKKFYQLKELAARWEMNIKTVRGIVARREIRVNRMGRNIRVSIEELERYETETREIKKD